ncbi:hypothetical protein [Parvularcula sp. IMCC14364]|uniref:hypothetical protein n=1 Tax=Parvularcula sp. IMCC14364 TaxID=3067902 RepID=UPI002741AEC0|nr:hypothetical protein [Parvularcula sp. IMCC14364]
MSPGSIPPVATPLVSSLAASRPPDRGDDGGRSGDNTVGNGNAADISGGGTGNTGSAEVSIRSSSGTQAPPVAEKASDMPINDAAIRQRTSSPAASVKSQPSFAESLFTGTVVEAGGTLFSESQQQQAGRLPNETSLEAAKVYELVRQIQAEPAPSSQQQTNTTFRAEAQGYSSTGAQQQASPSVAARIQV